MPIEIFDTSTSKWIGIYNYNIFRHTAWIYENFIYIHGGFLLNKEGAEINNVMKKIDLSKIFNALNIKYFSIYLILHKVIEWPNLFNSFSVVNILLALFSILIFI